MCAHAWIPSPLSALPIYVSAKRSLEIFGCCFTVFLGVASLQRSKISGGTQVLQYTNYKSILRKHHAYNYIWYYFIIELVVNELINQRRKKLS